MSRADLVASLKAGLLDAAKAFTAPADADFVRHLDAAAADMHRVRPRTLIGEVALVGGQGEYAGPADLVRFKSPIWGALPDWSKPKPWEKTWPGPLPKVRLLGDGRLSMAPAPSAQQIAALGSAYRFYYVGRDAIGDQADDTTISPDDRHWLLMRAQAEALGELANRDSVRPTKISDGFSGQAKTGTPAGLRDYLMTAWLLAAR